MPSTIPTGNPKTAKYILVNDYPTRLDTVRARPFSAPDGKELDTILQRANIKRSECYITYLFKDFKQPLFNFIKYRKGSAPHITELGQQCIKELFTELNECESKIIIGFGNAVLYALSGRVSEYKWRGSILYPTDLPSKTLIPTIHPSSITEKYQPLNRHLIFFDIRRAKEISDGSFKFIPKNCIIKPSYFDCINFLDNCIDAVKSRTHHWIAYDIEVSNLEMSCISFTINYSDCICIPFTGPGGDYFSLDQEANLMLKIAYILEHPDIPILGQNLVFDIHFLLRKYGIKPQNIHDTMIAQHTLMPEYKKGLDMIASLWTDIPYYKEDGKFWLKGQGSWERGWEYNALDSLVCTNAIKKQITEIRLQDNIDTYNRTRKVILPLVYMMERGVLIDIERMKEAYITTGDKIKQVKLDLNEVAGRTLNANSPLQLKKYFYEEKKIKPYKKKGKASTDEDAMKRLSRRGFKEAEIILNIRRRIKERSTYLDPEKVDKDGRMRCSYNPVGTRYSRLSSSKTIFGTGNNLQNQPHNILEYFLADPGYIGYEIDLSQAENRIVAYVGRVIAMINAFETGQDVHSLTGALISGKTVEEIIAENKAEIMCPLAGGTKTWRFWGKKSNHGFNYDWGPDNFSLKNEIPVSAGRTIYNGYHSVYPEVQSNFHGYVKTQLIKNRTLINLMGRKTIFMDDLANHRNRDKVFKAAYSCIPQGTVGDMINERALNFVYYNSKFEPVELLMQVHDSIKFQIPISIGFKQHAELLMSIKEELELPLTTHYGREFIIPADIQMGDNFGHMKEFKAPQIGSNRGKFADMLSEKWKEIKNVE